MEKRHIVLDTETTGLNLVRDRLCLIQICTEHNEIHLIKINKNSNAPVILNILSDDKILKIFHFARFDLAVLMKQFNCNISITSKKKSIICVYRTSTSFKFERMILVVISSHSCAVLQNILHQPRLMVYDYFF